MISLLLTANQAENTLCIGYLSAVTNLHLSDTKRDISQGTESG